MVFEFKLPDIGEGVVEGEVMRWIIQDGDPVVEDQAIVEIQTDKATVEIPSPVAGIVKKCHFPEGAMCPVGAVLISFEVEGDDNATEQEAPAPADADESATQTEAVSAAVETEAVSAAVETEPSPAPARSDTGRVRAAPATRKLARELSVDITQIQGTGPGGRVSREDVIQASTTGAAPSAAPAQQMITPQAAPRPRPAPLPVGPDEHREPLRGIRKVISESMRRSIDLAAHFTYVEEVDCTRLVATRSTLKPIGLEQNVKITYLAFVVKACVQALRQYPYLNATIDDASQEIVVKNRYHIGVAAATDRGLVVPVIHNADQKTLLDVAAEIQDLGNRARTGNLKVDEMQNGTFTITSLGAMGGVLATPIINHPEVAILGIHQMKDRPVVRDGEIVVRPMMNVACSFDHRLIDGHVGAAFVQSVRAYLEEPSRLLLDMR